VGGPEPALAFAGNAKRMIDVPVRELRQIEHIVVTNEIADTMPETHALLRQHGVAAVVPFYPHSRTAASWMLLGDSFSEHVYTPLDFKMVEQLFDRLGELFLDKLLFLRSQLHDAREQLQTLQLRYDMSQQESVEARRQIVALRSRIADLERERAKPAAATNPPAQILSLVAESAVDEKPLARQLRELESRMIVRALQRSGGDIAKAAALLELSVETLRDGIERCRLAGQVKGAAD
jgi:transcriptional regulator with GAF, ATPase, and Fis domain